MLLIIVNVKHAEVIIAQNFLNSVIFFLFITILYKHEYGKGKNFAIFIICFDYAAAKIPLIPSKETFIEESNNPSSGNIVSIVSMSFMRPVKATESGV